MSRNKPYAGGFITEHYGNPAAGLHAIQLEFNRALYMDERRFERSAGFDRLAADLDDAGGAAGRHPAGGTAALSRGGRIARSQPSKSTLKQRHKKKGPSASRRPKSREETPKEGGGEPSRSPIPRCTNMLPQRTKRKASLTYSPHGC